MPIGSVAKLAFATTLAALVLFAACSTASANRLKISSKPITVAWPALKFENLSETTVACPVTLEGTFHSATIVKTLNLLVGFITRAATESASCTGGELTVLQATLPWHWTYEGFTGSLPVISGVKLLLVGLGLSAHARGSFTCLMRAEARHPLNMILALNTEGEVTTLEPERGSHLPLTGELCLFTEGILRETRSTVTPTGGTASVSITLI